MLLPSWRQNPRLEEEKEIETPDKSVGMPKKEGILSGFSRFNPKDSMFWLANAEKKLL